MSIQPEPDVKRKRSLMWNVMTLLVLFAVVCVVAYVVVVFRDPQTMVNFFKPELTATVFSTETPTITPLQQPATWTPTITVRPAASRTRASTWTLFPGLASETPTQTPSLTFTASITTTAMPAVAEITYQASTETHPELDCNWLGVGGNVVDSGGAPLAFQSIQLGGALGEVMISQLRISGKDPAYGTAGYEFVLAERPADSTQTLWVQLFDTTGKELTEKIFFDTFDDCTRNLVRINFTRNR